MRKSYKFLYNHHTKALNFRGGTLDDLRNFPVSTRREVGYQLAQVQNEQAPADWKPRATVGKGVQEIRIRDNAGPFQVIYVAKFSDMAYMLHRFKNNPQKANKS